MLFWYDLGVAGFNSKGIQITIWMRSLRRCDCAVFVCPCFAGFASRWIQIII